MKEHPIDIWHRLVEHRTLDGLEGLLDTDIVFFSPVVHTPQRGKEVALRYFAAAFQVILNPTFHYVRQIMGGTEAMLEFEVEIDGIKINGVDIVAWNEGARITEFKVMIRPLKGINLLHQRMGHMLQASR